VVNAVGNTLDVTKHHGGRGVHAEPVSDAHGRQPCLGVALTDADLAAHGRGEDLAPASGHAVEAGLLHRPHDPVELLLQRLARRIEEAHELDQLRGAERVDVQRGEPVLDCAQQVEIPVQRQVRVHAALHEDLGAADLDELADLLQQLLEGQRIRVVLVPVAAKGAERAAGRADVRVVDVAIDDVGPKDLAVDPPAAGVGPAAELVDRHLVVEAQGLLRADPQRAGGHIVQHRRVENVQFVSCGSRHRSTTWPGMPRQAGGP
jgi:hypothetical protein